MYVSRAKQRQEILVVMVALALVVLLGAAALIVDVGRLALAKQSLQDTADAAAPGATVTLPIREET